MAARLNDVIAFDPDPSAHVLNIKDLFKQLQKHNRKISPSKAKIGATDATCLGHANSPAGVRSNASTVAVLSKM